MSRSNRSPSPCRAAIIGLGQIGHLFDDDPKRDEGWTHAGVYEAHPQVQLIAGADTNPDRVAHFVKRRIGTRGYLDYYEMLETETVDLLSVCGPTHLHDEMARAGLQAGVRAIFCEKPLVERFHQAVDLVEACESAGVLLAVNHTRRWESIYRRAKDMIAEGVIGSIESLAGYYPGKVYTMGTHLFDLMRFFAGEVKWVCGDGAIPPQGEANLSGLIHFNGGARGFVLAGNNRTNHVFELDLVGSRGRIRLSGDGGRIEAARFMESPRYTGYRELADPSVQAAAALGRNNRLMRAVEDILKCIGTTRTPACNGRDGMAALEIAEALHESVRLGHSKVDLPLLPSPALLDR